VPDGWYHSTYNSGLWTVSVAGEGPVEGRFHGDACLGKTADMQQASLAELEAAVDSNNRNPLHIAAWSGYSGDMINYLVDRGMDINLPDKDWMTPLHYSVNNFEHIVEVLLKRGARPDAVDGHRRTPFHYIYSISDPNMRVPKMLHEHGGDPFAVDKYGERPIHLMARCGNSKVVEWLLSLGEGAEVLNNVQVTPVHYAVRYSHTGVLRVLLPYVKDRMLILAMQKLAVGRNYAATLLLDERMAQLGCGKGKCVAPNS